MKFFFFLIHPHSENQQFLKEIMNAVLEGEGIGWLKLSKLKKLMEDENYRNLIVSRLDKALERKVGPDDHIEDVCITKPVWKGLLKLAQAMIAGLEHTYFHSKFAGLASALFILEIAHTHYWARELAPGQTIQGGQVVDADGRMIVPATVTSTALSSQASSPFGSSDNLRALAQSGGDLSPGQAGGGHSPSAESAAEVTVDRHSGQIAGTGLLAKLHQPSQRFVSTESTDAPDSGADHSVTTATAGVVVSLPFL